MDEYWLILQLGNGEEARSLFAWYKDREIPTLLLWNTFMEGYLVAAYADDPLHRDAGREVDYRSYVDGYLGVERLWECLLYHVLLDYAGRESDSGWKATDPDCSWKATRSLLAKLC